MSRKDNTRAQSAFTLAAFREARRPVNLRGGERVTFSGVLPWSRADTNMLRLEIRKTNPNDTLICTAVRVGSRPFRMMAYANPDTKGLKFNMEGGGNFETIR